MNATVLIAASLSPSDWERVWQRLFGWRNAFDHPVVQGLVTAIVILVIVSGLMIQWSRRTDHLSSEGYRDVYLRWRSWIFVSAMILAPILLGAAWTIGAVALLSLACWFEFARATGMLSEWALGGVVAAGICLVALAAVDHYDRLFFASVPFTVVLLTVVTIPADRPAGYVRRVALATSGFLLFAFCLGYVGYFSNVADLGNGADYRPLVMTMILAVAMNDILAYCIGKTFGRIRLLPNTSPGKTLGGSLGALLVAGPVIAGLFHFVLRGTPADRWPVLAVLGVCISLLGQLGDLVISSIKRDAGIKDTGDILPGHGGLLDRFDSLILVPPFVFHYLSYHLGPLAAGEPARIFSGG